MREMKVFDEVENFVSCYHSTLLSMFPHDLFILTLISLSLFRLELHFPSSNSDLI